MIAKLARKLALALLILVVCTACGSAASFLTQMLAGGGIGGTGIGFGPITGFGSIFVNGVEFDTKGAAITIDGKPAVEGDLRKGMVVTVQGTIDGETGVGAAVIVESSVRGPVDEDVTDANARTVQVLGQTIHVDDTVVLENLGDEEGDPIPFRLNDLKKNTIVSVSGLVKSNGTIAATRIELFDTAPTVNRVQGLIENVNTTLETFEIGELRVDYSAADLSGLPGGVPANGLLVTVEGQLSDGADRELLADKVEPLDLGLLNVKRAEVSGFVTKDNNAPNEFTMGNLAVRTDSVALFAGGSASEILVKTKLEVEGELVNGVLIADKVTFLDNITLESDADTVSISEGFVTLVGLPGIIVNVDELTGFTNAASLNDISPGDHLHIRGRVNTTGALVATQLRKELPTPNVILQAAVDTAIDPHVVIRGVTIDTTGFTDEQFKGLDELAIGRAAFFDPSTGAAPGVLVRASGELFGGVINWNEVALEE